MRLHVHEYGDPAGPPVVCLHGVTGHGERFRKLAEERLTARRVLALDLRGHGRSGVEPPWNTATHVADALETARAAGVEQADWMGFSYGGLVAAALALSEPARVQRLVLLDPALHIDPQGCLEQARAEAEDVSFETVEEAIADRLAAGTLFHTPREFLEEEMSQALVRGADGRLRYRHERPAAIGAWSEMAGTPPPVADVPTLLVRGKRSFIELDAHEDRYRAALGDRLQVVSTAGGHSVLWDDFDTSASAVASFLDGQPTVR